MSNLPPITDHAFMRMLRDQCNTPKPMSRIASELGVDVDALCEWIMAYKEPRQQQYQNKGAGPILADHAGDPDPWSLPANAKRFAAWRKAQAGAAETRRMLEITQQ